MRRLLILSAFVLMPSVAFAGCLPTGPMALPCLGGAALETLDSFLGQPSASGRCGRGSHGTIDMYGNKGCAPGAGALSKRSKSAAAQKPGTIKACPMGSVMARGPNGNFCRDVPGALHARR